MIDAYIKEIARWNIECTVEHIGKDLLVLSFGTLDRKVVIYFNGQVPRYTFGHMPIEMIVHLSAVFNTIQMKLYV